MSTWFRTYGFAEVEENLLIGAFPLDSEDVAMLSWQRVDRVLNLVQDDEYPGGEHEAVEEALHEAGIEEYRLETIDHGQLPVDLIDAAVSAMQEWLEQGHRIYLHCRAGWQRSPALAAAVIAARDGIDVVEALARVQTHKPSADPLPHQLEDLRSWWDARRGQAAPAAES